MQWDARPCVMDVQGSSGSQGAQAQGSGFHKRTVLSPQCVLSRFLNSRVLPLNCCFGAGKKCKEKMQGNMATWAASDFVVWVGRECSDPNPKC